MVRIIGTKIRKLREEMELTQEDLARSVGLSSEFISLLELGRRSPSLESLSRIAKFLNKEISFFILERAESFDTLIKGEKLDLKTRRLLKKFRKYCDDYLGLEEMTGRQSDLAPLYGNVSAEKMAAQERSRLELGEDPVSNVFLLLEQNGLHVCRFPIQDEINIAGAFVFLEYKQAAFALVNSRQPFLQQALTAVHEYGHYLKDRFDGPIIDNPDIFIEDYITLYHGREKYVQTFAYRRGISDLNQQKMKVKNENFHPEGSQNVEGTEIEKGFSYPSLFKSFSVSSTFGSDISFLHLTASSSCSRAFTLSPFAKYTSPNKCPASPSAHRYFILAALLYADLAYPSALSIFTLSGVEGWSKAKYAFPKTISAPGS